MSGILWLLLGFALYLLPSLVSWARGVRARIQNGVFLLNLLLGWTGVGWIGALVWAVAAEAAE